MKTMMTALAALLLTTAACFAQENEQTAGRERPTVEQMARKTVERMTAQLNLNEKQAEQAYTAVLERLRTTEALRGQMRAAQSAEAERMKSILTTDQFVKWSQSQRQGRGPQTMKRERAKGAADRPNGDEAAKMRRARN